MAFRVQLKVLPVRTVVLVVINTPSNKEMMTSAEGADKYHGDDLKILIGKTCHIWANGIGVGFNGFLIAHC